MQKNITKTKNILFAGIGGQGIILASEIISQTLFEAGYDVKKSEIHGMSQRGGSVTSEIRFGDKVYSPLIPNSEVDFLVIFNDTELERNRIYLSETGEIIRFEESDIDFIQKEKVKNVYLLGKLAYFLPVNKELWLSVIKDMVPPAYLEENLSAFINGYEKQSKTTNK